MNRSGSLRRFFFSRCALATLMVIPVGVAAAPDDFDLPRVQRVAPPGQPACISPMPPTLGTFQPTPYIMVRGNWPTGGGYTPLQLYGDQSMMIYGPISPFRSVAAPVMTYSRGYDGRVYALPGTSFSTPNLPELTPVIYPTPANYYYAPRVSRTPPQWTTGINWIDQN
jgi:hypothetical protein